VAFDEVLLIVVFLLFGLHIGSPRGSNLTHFAGIALAVTFLELVLWFATHEGALP
jgi:hypothetical protein